MQDKMAFGYEIDLIVSFLLTMYESNLSDVSATSNVFIKTVPSFVS